MFVSSGEAAIPAGGSSYIRLRSRKRRWRAFVDIQSNNLWKEKIIFRKKYSEWWSIALYCELHKY